MSSSELNSKFFGCCTVEWRVEKFSFQMYGKDWLIQSPEFTITGSEETSWFMDLRPKLNKGKNLVSFSMRRSAVDSGPKYIWLNLEISCKIADLKCVHFKNRLRSLKNGSRIDVLFGSIDYFLSLMTLSDDFTIVCHMIIQSSSVIGESEECNHEGLKLLSKNMLELYRSAQNFDTKLIFGDNVILAHRAVLSARNDFLCSIIEDEYDEDDDDDDDDAEFPRCTILNFTDELDYKGMQKILGYLYTGDIRHVLEEPSFHVYHCASYLDISEVESYYEPDKLLLKSTIDFEEYSYSLHGYKIGSSHLIWHCNPEEKMKTYRLLFCPQKDLCSDYIPLFMKTFDIPILAYIKLDFVDVSGRLCTTHIITAQDVHIDMDGIIGGIIKKLNSSFGNAFEVNVNLKIITNKKTSCMNHQKSSSVSRVNKDYYYECLSADLEFLMDGGPYTDTLIDNNGVYFWVHKCIVTTRSQMISDIMSRNEEGEVIDISNLEPRIVSLLLTYLYSGLLSDVIDDDVIEVYKAAALSSLFQLKSMCSYRLKLSFEINRNIRCRVMRIADEYEDAFLMRSALSYLFDKNQISLIPGQLTSFHDVYTCRHCLPPSEMEE